MGSKINPPDSVNSLISIKNYEIIFLDSSSVIIFCLTHLSKTEIDSPIIKIEDIKISSLCFALLINSIILLVPFSNSSSP